MKVIDAVDLVVKIYREGHSVKAVVTNAAPEASWVVGLTHRLQDLENTQVLVGARDRQYYPWSLVSWDLISQADSACKTCPDKTSPQSPIPSDQGLSS